VAVKELNQFISLVIRNTANVTDSKSMVAQYVSNCIEFVKP
jgi:hypothetical protein